jgi:hypothetical protein
MFPCWSYFRLSSLSGDWVIRHPNISGQNKSMSCRIFCHREPKWTSAMVNMLLTPEEFRHTCVHPKLVQPV